jgi:hypothetical protein
MRDISRRDLFRQLIDSASESLSSIIPTPSARREAESGWVQLAQWSELAPGESRAFDVGGVKGFLHSNAVGVYAKRDDESSVALRLTAHGTLELNILEKWPQGQGLSHLTGLPVYFESKRSDSDE